MKYFKKKDRSPLTRLERFQNRQEQLQKRLTGDGRYRFRNNTPGDLGLPKPAEDGRTALTAKGPGAEFIGDSYFLSMVPQMLVLVEDLNVAKVNENKLLTEQPPLVTNEGRVEFVQQGKQQPLNEGKPGKQPDVLLTEDPVGGVVIAE